MLRILSVLLIPLFSCLCLSAYPCGAATDHVKSSILFNLSTGQILYERNPYLQIPPASLTKIMTMFLTLDAVKARKIKLTQKARVPAYAAKVGGSAMRLTPGEQVPIVRLLAGAAVASGNDAALVLAQFLAGKPQKFVEQMNAKARALGMKRTHFKNPTGLPAAGHTTCAKDLLLLCKAYLREHPQASRFHSMKFFMHKGAVVRNTNPLLGRVNGVDGLKTGWTTASGYNLIVSAKRGKTRLLAILLGCASRQDRDNAAIRLIETGFHCPTNASIVRKILAH